MDLDTYLRLRPVAWHLTSARNVARLRETGRLECTQSLMLRAGRAAARERRKASETIRVDGHDVVIRDQAPLFEGNIGFEEGWDFARLLQHLDSHVFFWPGTDAGPVPSGRRHFARYIDAGESLAFLRVDAKALVRENGEPRFSVYNSGSPRMTGGRPSPRGSRTFLPAAALDRTAGDVVEMVFVGEARLPRSTVVSSSPAGPWSPLP